MRPERNQAAEIRILWTNYDRYLLGNIERYSTYWTNREVASAEHVDAATSALAEAWLVQLQPFGPSADSQRVHNAAMGPRRLPESAVTTG
jgi:hypothetical protein